MTTLKRPPEQHDIIQLIPTHKWGAALAVVDEVRPWGVQAYVLIPHNDGTPPGAAYIRLETGDFEQVGSKAIFVRS